MVNGQRQDSLFFGIAKLLPEANIDVRPGPPLLK